MTVADGAPQQARIAERAAAAAERTAREEDDKARASGLAQSLRRAERDGTLAQPSIRHSARVQAAHAVSRARVTAGAVRSASRLMSDSSS